MDYSALVDLPDQFQKLFAAASANCISQSLELCKIQVVAIVANNVCKVPWVNNSLVVIAIHGRHGHAFCNNRHFQARNQIFLQFKAVANHHLLGMELWPYGVNHHPPGLDVKKTRHQGQSRPLSPGQGFFGAARALRCQAAVGAMALPLLQSRRAADHLGDFLGDLGLAGPVVLHGQRADHVAGVLGRRFHGNAAGNLLAHSRIQEALE